MLTCLQVNFLHSLGLSVGQVKRVVAAFPTALLILPLAHLEAAVAALQSCGFTERNLGRLLSKAPAVLGVSPEDIYSVRRCAGQHLVLARIDTRIPCLSCTWNHLSTVNGHEDAKALHPCKTTT